MSTDYRIYVLEGEHIAAVRVCECTTDADALLEADAVLQASQYLAAEIWNGPPRVDMLSKPAAQ